MERGDVGAREKRLADTRDSEEDTEGVLDGLLQLGEIPGKREKKGVRERKGEKRGAKMLKKCRR